MRHLIVFALLASPALLSAQTGTVSPGMSHAQVVAALGEPVTSRTKDEYTYLFYQNACGRECGMNDLVTLLRDSVVDAIFRSPDRHYTGTSSSPTEATPVRVAKRRGTPKATPVATPVAATGTRKVIEVKGTNREVDASGAAVEAKPAPKPEATMADKPEPKPAAAAPKPAPATVAGTRKVVEVKGTNREVTVSGTKTESTTEPVKMAPNKANDTRPSIPLNPPMVNPAPSPAPDKKPTS
jgi:hypothetical protein